MSKRVAIVVLRVVLVVVVVFPYGAIMFSLASSGLSVIIRIVKCIVQCRM